jgi:hypothetical protein
MKFSAKGSIIKTGTKDSAPSTEIGQVESGEVDLGGLNLTDVTTLEDLRKNYVPGTHEAMTMNVTLTWDPALTGHAAAMTAYLAKTQVSAGITYSDAGAAVVYSNGFWSNVSTPVAVDGKLSATFNFKGSGELTFAA